MMKRICSLIEREFQTEIRKKSTIAGILLFTITIVYLIYKTFNVIKPFEWNILFWIVLIFSGINAIAKSFIQDNNESRLHEYTLYNPIELILSKLIYNFLFLTFIFFIIYLGFSFFLHNPIMDKNLFFGGSILGVLGISGIYTLIAAISNAGKGGSLLMSILGIPLTLPLILLLIKISSVSMRIIQDTSVMKDIIILISLDLITIGMILILFRILWID